MPFVSIILLLVAVLVIVAIFRAVRIVKQSTAIIVERLGRFQAAYTAGMHFLVPFVDRVRNVMDLREQVVSFPPQPVITSDNLVVSIDSVVYYQITDPMRATYEISNYLQAIEQLTVTTLRNVVGSMDLEQTLTSRDQINGQLRGVLDQATGRWGIRVNSVELKSIDPPASIQGSMEQQMRAERDRRAAILTAEGVKQSQILTAEGDKQSAILRAEGQAQSAILKAQGESRAILQVFDAIHRGNADSKLLAYQYLQTLPKIANGSSSKMWIVPTEFTAALDGIAVTVTDMLETIQKAMYERAKEHRDTHTYDVKSMEEFAETVKNRPGFVRAMWCGDRACEDKIKEEVGATSRCIPFAQETISETCVCCGKPAKKMVYWGIAY